MKKALFILFTLIPLLGFAQRQEVEVRRIEWSLNFGASLFGDDYYGTSASDDGYVFCSELRYNFRRIPMDVGIMSCSNMRSLSDDDLIWWDDLSFLAVTDYNFRRGRAISYFAGVGAGVTVYNEDVAKLCFMPRLGVEFFNHLRITAEYMVGFKAKNTINVTLGVVIGGGRKK